MVLSEGEIHETLFFPASSSQYQLSLAQLEERKTVTVVSNALKCHLEARGSM
jgi:hypothetical protein